MGHSAVVVLVLLVLGVTSSPAQTTWYVDAGSSGSGSGTQADPFQSLQDAITAAVNGDTILVAPGVYGPGTTVNEDLVIRGTAGPSATTITGSTQGPACVIDGTGVTCTIEGFTFSGGQ